MSDGVRPGTARSAVVSLARVESLTLRDFRSYERADVALGPCLTVVSGRNGAAAPRSPGFVSKPLPCVTSVPVF